MQDNNNNSQQSGSNNQTGNQSTQSGQQSQGGNTGQTIITDRGANANNASERKSLTERFSEQKK